MLDLVGPWSVEALLNVSAAGEQIELGGAQRCPLQKSNPLKSRRSIVGQS